MHDAINHRTRTTVIWLFASMLTILALSIPFIAMAGSFSYEGYGIRAWPSVGSAGITAKTTGTVRHKQTRNFSQDKVGMTVYVRRQEWWGWSNVASKTFVGNTSGSFSTACSPGTYKLYFESKDQLYTYDISGTFSWR